MDEPIRANNIPYAIDVKAGRKYWWCSCGRSKKQPFCDGRHKGTNFSPVMFENDKDETICFCGCKQTCDSPLCDGSHSKEIVKRG